MIEVCAKCNKNYIDDGGYCENCQYPRTVIYKNNMWFNKRKTTREVLEERDRNEYSEYTSKKAEVARHIAIRTQYFLPYFCYDENAKELGMLFGYKLKYK